jgi:hypothetical protein
MNWLSELGSLMASRSIDFASFMDGSYSLCPGMTVV